VTKPETRTEAARPARPPLAAPAQAPVVAFDGAASWARWLEENHAASRGVWLKLAKKGSQVASVSYADALTAALCWGWIDGQKQAFDKGAWLQKFTPRAARSLWSKVNREKAEALIAAGEMRPPGLEEIARAGRDGRWGEAYDPASRASVPADLASALAANPRAEAFFATLEARNRYAVLFRVQTAKKADTRARRIATFVAMCERGEKIHP
jgi:uncharacterized protein YdeI (YjbR/CyaY-like superfamily)